MRLHTAVISSFRTDANNQAMMDSVRAASGKAASYYIGVLGRE